MPSTDQMNRNSTSTIDDSLGHDHHHNYNEIDSTLVSVGKNDPDHLNKSQTLVTNEIINSNGKTISLNNPSKGIFA
jgi:hypothetical protein